MVNAPQDVAWQNGYGTTRRINQTVARLKSLIDRLDSTRTQGDRPRANEVLIALDRVCSAAMLMVVHQTYAKNVYLDGRPLQREDFKPKPAGHTGGSLNMVPAYAGDLAANVLSSFTRSWLMGQGHCVSAIDSVNVLVDNMTEVHKQRYSVSDECS